jgi:hypothetical protein
MTQTKTSEPEVIKPEGAKVCQGPLCPLCTPLGLALFLTGFMTVFYAPRPYNMIGWVVVLLAYLKGFLGIKG